jgi:hypothetical protein
MGLDGRAYRRVVRVPWPKSEIDMTGEKLVEIAAKFYDARRTAKGVYGDRWPATCATYQGYIHAVMKKKKKDELSATIHLMKLLTNKMGDAGWPCMCLMAACADMLEPEVAK